jgi:hypothetical protein
MSTIKADNYEATTAGNNLIFKANGTEKMRISPNVGGVTNITGVGVGLGGSAINLNSNGTTVHIHENIAGGSSILHCTNAAQGLGAAKGFICGLWGPDSNNAYVFTYDPVSMYFGTSANIRMTITSAGDVGIGTTSPAAKLDVNGEVRSSTSTTSASNAKTLTTKDYVDSIFRVGAVVTIGTNMTAVTTPQGVPSGWTVTLPSGGNATIRIPSGGGTWLCTWIHRGGSGTIGLGYVSIVAGTDGTFPLSNGGVIMWLRRIS